MSSWTRPTCRRQPVVTRAQIDKLAVRVDGLAAMLFPTKEIVVFSGPDGWNTDLIWERHCKLHPGDRNAKTRVYLRDFGDLTPAYCLELVSDAPRILSRHTIDKSAVASGQRLREEVAGGRHPDLKYRETTIIDLYMQPDGKTRESNEEA